MKQHIIKVSGGKDSEAVYTLAARRYANKIGQWRAVFCDTGNEHEWTLEHVATMHERIGGPKVEVIRADFSKDMERKRKFIAEKWPEHGVPQDRVDRALELMTPTGNPFLDLCIMKGRFPSTKARFCTEELKILPTMRQIIFPALKAGPVLQWIGVRRDESQARANTPLMLHDDGGRSSYKWYPIRHWTAAQTFDYLRSEGVSPNPLYRRGMRRVGCMPCIDCQKGELKEIGLQFPNHIDRIEEWEALVSEASKRGVSTFFAGDTDPMDRYNGEGDAYAGIRRCVEWSRTDRGGRQFNLMTWLESAEPSVCQSVYGLCE